VTLFSCISVCLYVLVLAVTIDRLGDSKDQVHSLHTVSLGNMWT